MKRTRRIEVISYSRRVTVTTGTRTPAVLTDHTEPPAIDITPTEEAVNAAPKQEDKGSGTNGVSAHEPPRRRPTLRLRDLLRLGW